MPYAIDLVRVAASAVLAIREGRLRMSADDGSRPQGDAFPDDRIGPDLDPFREASAPRDHRRVMNLRHVRSTTADISRDKMTAARKVTGTGL